MNDINGIEDCLECRGTGEEECEVCRGSGWARCIWCDGPGSYCNECHGEGRVWCEECDGSGGAGCAACDGEGALGGCPPLDDPGAFEQLFPPPARGQAPTADGVVQIDRVTTGTGVVDGRSAC